MKDNEHQHTHAHAHDASTVASAGRAEADRRILARDPVCGMDVDPATAAASIEHDGRTIYFCCTRCLERFREDPARYATADGVARP